MRDRILWGKLVLILGALGLLSLWLLSTLTLEDVLASGNWAIFRSLNGSLGENVVLDVTALVAAGRTWFYGCYLLIAGLALAAAWRSRRSHHGRLFGTVLVAALLTFLSDAIIAEVGESIAEPAPWHEFDALGQILVADATNFAAFRSLAPFPDPNLVGWTVLAVLLLPRLPVTALIAFGLLCAHGLARISVGIQWGITEVASVLIGMVFGGAVLILGERIFEWAERKSEVVLVSLWPRPMLGLKESKRRGPDRPRSVMRALELRGKRRDRRWKRLVDQRVLPILGVTQHSTKLEKCPPGQSPATMRPARHVRFLTLPGGEVFVLKMVRRLTVPFAAPTRVRRLAQAARCQFALERLRFPVPRLYWTSVESDWLGVSRTVLLIEECIQGRSFDPTDPEDRRDSARLLAHMHSHRREEWGGLAELEGSHDRYGWILQVLRPEVLWALRRLERVHNVRFSDRERDHLWLLFEEHAIALLGQPDVMFRLTHGDVHKGNFLRGQDETLRVIDFLTVRYDLAGTEILGAPLALSVGDPAALADFWRIYYDASSAGHYESFRREATLGLARHGLRELAQGRALYRDQKALTKARIVEWMRDLLHEQPELWGASPEETRWTEILNLMALKSFLQPPAPPSGGQPEAISALDETAAL